MRLDDASEHMNLNNWIRMKEMLDNYSVRPIFGIIPCNKDPELLEFEVVDNFWNLIISWIDDGWVPAMHGFEHIFETNDGGINPVNHKSEFAGLSLDKQKKKISSGYSVLKEHEIFPEIFFAPAHTFDKNTLRALSEETPIRIISDTPTWNVYCDGEFCFIPQQSGRVRKLPFQTVTFCYHPNTMDDEDFEELNTFLSDYFANFSVPKDVITKRRMTIMDRLINKSYFGLRKIRNITGR